MTKPGKQGAETFLFVASDSYEWKLHDYKKLLAPKSMLRSPTFLVDGVKCWITIYPRGDAAANREWFSMFLTVRAPVETTFTFAFLDADGQVLPVPQRSMEFSYTYEKNSRGWGSSRIIRTNQMDDFLRDGTLRVRTVVNIHTVVTKEHNALVEVEKSIPEDDTLSNDISKIMAEFPHDIEFDVSGEIIKAHKMILSVRSTVFSAMFSGGMKEHTSKVVQVTDIQPDIFKAMIQYIYSGVCDTDLACTRTEDYLYMADKYDLVGLRRQIEKILVSGVGVDNALSMLSVASAFSLEALHKVAIDIVRNNFRLIKSSKLFKDMCNFSPDLFEEVLDEVAHIDSKHHSKEGGAGKEKIGFFRRHFGKPVVV